MRPRGQRNIRPTIINIDIVKDFGARFYGILFVLIVAKIGSENITDWSLCTQDEGVTL